MDARTYEFQSDFARECIAIGRSEGRTEGKIRGRAELVTRLLACRFGPLDEQARARIQRASIADLDAIGERLLTARTVGEALEVGEAKEGVS